MFPVQPLQGLFNLHVSAVETPFSYQTLSQILDEDCQAFRVSPRPVFASSAHS